MAGTPELEIVNASRDGVGERIEEAWTGYVVVRHRDGEAVVIARSHCRGRRQCSARQAAVPVTVSNVARQRNEIRMDKISKKLTGTECCSARWVEGARKERCEEESARTRACRSEQRWRAEIGRQRL